MRKHRFYHTLLSLLAAPAIWAQPTLKVAASTQTMHVYDSVGILATPRDSLGRRASTARITWVTRPHGAITIRLDSLSRGQRGVAKGFAIGGSYAVASWKRSDGRTLRDSIHLTVTSPEVIAVSVYFRAYRDSFTGQILRDSTGATLGPVLPGQTLCVFTTFWDRGGNALTGQSRTLTSLNPSVAQFGVSGVVLNTVCPDTTVDPARLVP